MYSMDDILRFQGASTLDRTLDRHRTRTGVRRKAQTTDINAFLAACGVKGRRK